MLLSLPDLYAQLAETLQRLFADFGIAAWKLQRRQRLQFAGMVHHHMAHWNRGAGRLAAAAGRHGHPSTGGGESSSGGGGGAEPASRGDARPHPRRSQLQGTVGGGHRQHGRGPASAGHLLSTSYVLDRGVYQGLVRVQAALETLSLQVRGFRWWAQCYGLLLMCPVAPAHAAKPCTAHASAAGRGDGGLGGRRQPAAARHRLAGGEHRQRRGEGGNEGAARGGSVGWSGAAMWR